jgi:putative phage-type endonuclease
MSNDISIENDLYKEIQYILDGLAEVHKDSVSEIVKLCVSTVSNLHDSVDEKLIEKYVDNIIHKNNNEKKQTAKKITLKLKFQNDISPIKKDSSNEQDAKRQSCYVSPIKSDQASSIKQEITLDQTSPKKQEITLDQTSPKKQEITLDQTSPKKQEITLDQTSPTKQEITLDQTSPTKLEITLDQTSPKKQEITLDQTSPTKQEITLDQTSPKKQKITLDQTSPKKQKITLDQTSPTKKEIKILDQVSPQKSTSPLSIKSHTMKSKKTKKYVGQNIREIVSEEKKIENREKIEKFMKLPHYKQKSQEWLDQRHNYLTASTIYHALNSESRSARLNLLTDKVTYGKECGFRGNSATQWGTKYEPVANLIYAYRNNAKIHDFGMITNDKYPVLGISPDGITEENMLEIKCTYSRIIDGKIKTEYYHQMQAQLAVCEFDETDFLECQFKEISVHCFYDDFDLNDDNNTNKEKGILIYYAKKGTNDDSREYLYSPIEYCDNMKKLKEWEENILKEMDISSDQYVINKTYWHLKVYSCQRVTRDPQWIIKYYPILKAFWDEVEHYRKVGVDQLKKDYREPIDADDDNENDFTKISKFVSNKNALLNNDSDLSPKNKSPKNKSPKNRSKSKLNTKTKSTQFGLLSGCHL